MQKTRSNGDILRFDPATDAFGAVKPDGTIRTYYKANPAVHGYPTNLDYYNAQ
jgi:filamentous hemagglutinin